MLAQIKNFWNDESGVTAIEYGLIAGLIAIAIITILGTLGGDLSTLFTTIDTKIKAVMNG